MYKSGSPTPRSGAPRLPFTQICQALPGWSRHFPPSLRKGQRQSAEGPGHSAWGDIQLLRCASRSPFTLTLSLSPCSSSHRIRNSSWPNGHQAQCLSPRASTKTPSDVTLQTRPPVLFRLFSVGRRARVPEPVSCVTMFQIPAHPVRDVSVIQPVVRSFPDPSIPLFIPRTPRAHRLSLVPEPFKHVSDLRHPYFRPRWFWPRRF